MTSGSCASICLPRVSRICALEIVMAAFLCFLLLVWIAEDAEAENFRLYMLELPGELSLKFLTGCLKDYSSLTVLHPFFPRFLTYGATSFLELLTGSKYEFTIDIEDQIFGLLGWLITPTI